MAGVDDIIRQWVNDVEKSGEIKANKGWGKPLELNDGYDQTPDKLRMSYRMLKNAGYVPWEIETMAKITELKEILKHTTQRAEGKQLRTQIAELQQKLLVSSAGNKT